MQQSTLRSVFLYGLTGVILLGAIILGVQFARNRSTNLANTGSEPIAASSQPTTDQNKPSTTKASEPKTSTSSNTHKSTGTKTGGQIAATGTGNDHKTLGTHTSTPAQVPATGAEDTLLVSFAAATLAFAGLYYAQSRRHYRQTALAS